MIIFMEINIKKPVVVCIGTPKVIGDSLGPKVGDLLIDKYKINAYVYGRTSSPVTGVNCQKYYEHVRTHHAESIIIAVDACLGKQEDVGKIKYSLEGLRAGSALQRKFEKFGDIGFLGVVAVKQEDNFSALLAVNSKEIDDLADKIAQKIQNLTCNLRLSYNF